MNVVHHNLVNMVNPVLMENVARNAPAHFCVRKDISAKEKPVYQGVSNIPTVQIRRFACPESVAFAHGNILHKWH